LNRALCDVMRAASLLAGSPRQVLNTWWSGAPNKKVSSFQASTAVSGNPDDAAMADHNEHEGKKQMRRRNWLLLATLLLASAAPASAQVKIGVLSDMNSLYADITGKGTGVAARLAAEDFGPVLGKPVEIVTADHQNKADVATNIARNWYDNEGVDM